MPIELLSIFHVTMVLVLCRVLVAVGFHVIDLVMFFCFNTIASRRVASQKAQWQGLLLAANGRASGSPQVRVTSVTHPIYK